MSKEIVIRFSSNAGRSRLNLAPTATLQELQEKVQGVTKVDAASQRLAFDDQGRRPVAGAPTASLASLGIVNGTQVYLLGAGATIEAQVLTKVPVPVEKEKTVPAVSDASTPGASSTAKPAPDALATTGGASGSALAKGGAGIDPKEWSSKADRKAKFECFDTFIRNRRYETSNLQGNKVHASIIMKDERKKGMVKIPPAISIKQQPYRHVDIVSTVNVDEIQAFYSYWKFDCIPNGQQRMGWLYGYYLEDSNYGEKDRGDGTRVALEAIYEPPQQMDHRGECVMQADPDKPQVDKIADALGLECVGHIFTTFALDGDQLLTSQEVQRIARLQDQYSSDAHFTKYRLSKFASCAVRPDPEADGDPLMRAFMVSDQCVALVRDGMLQEEGTGADVVVREAAKGECMPTFVVEDKDNRNIQTDFFVVPLADGVSKKRISLFTHAEFPRENRPRHIIQQDDLKKYFKKRSKQEPSWSRFADFHLLLYIAKAFDVDTCIQLCECVRDRKEIPEGLKILFESLLQ